MKKYCLFLFIGLSFQIFCQVGIGTKTPHSSAVLDLTSSSKGFLPSRIALTDKNDLTTIPNPAAGLLIYNTATAGTSPNSVTPGFYYYNGSSWVSIATGVPDATIDFSVNSNPNTAGTTFSPNSPQSKDYIYVSTIDGSQWTWNGSTYVIYVAANSPFYINTTTNDAGNNKTGAVSRPGVIGIGGNATIGTLFSMTQSATYGYGFQLQGIGVSGGTSTGAKWVLGYNATGNKQHWFGDYDAFNATTGATVTGKPDIIRFIHFTGQPAVIDALPLSTTGSGGANAGSGALNIGQWRVGIGSETTINSTLPLYTGHVHGTLGVDNLPTITNATSVLVKDPSTQQVKQELITDIKNTEFNLISTSTDAGNDKTSGIWRSGGIITGGASTSTMYGNLTTNGGTSFSGGVPYGTASIGSINNPTAGWTGAGFLFGNTTGGSNAFTATVNNDKIYYAWLKPNNTYSATSISNETGWMFGPNINTGLSPAYGLEAFTTFRIRTLPQITTATDVLVPDPSTGQVSKQLISNIKNTEWYSASSTNDAGGDKSGDIYRNGKVLLATQGSTQTSLFKDFHLQAGGTSLLNSSFGGGMLFSSNNGAGSRFFLEHTTANTNEKTSVIYNQSGLTYFGAVVSDNGGAWVYAAPLVVKHSNGFVGFATTNPLYQADINGTARIATLPQITTATDVLVPDPSSGQVSKESISVFKRPNVKEITADYTLAAADEGYVIYVNSSSTVTITVPSMVVGFSCEIIQEGSGQVTLVNGTGNTLRSANGLKTHVQYSSISVKFKTTALSTVTGDSTI